MSYLPRATAEPGARVASVASEGCYMTSLVYSSAIHHILLRPSSWPLLVFPNGASITACAFFRLGSA